MQLFVSVGMQVGDHKPEDPTTLLQSPKEAYLPTPGQGCLPGQTFSESMGLYK